jgi:hypothetical protein
MRSRRWLVLAACVAGGAAEAAGQSVEAGRAGPRAVLDVAGEVALARSAAPAAVSDSARVLVWNGSDFDVAAEGTNGATCYVARSWPESLEPHCFDAEGARTILPIHLLQMRLWHRGAAADDVNAAIADGLRTGALRLPSRPAMSYMMSAGQKLISEDGRPVGAWQPHLMIYYPYLTERDLGLGMVPSLDAAIVVDPGTPLSNITIVVRQFVPYAEQASNR